MDQNTGEPFIGAHVTDTISKSVTRTNNYGFFTLRNIIGTAALRTSYAGFKSDILHLVLIHDTLINLQISPLFELSEVVVSSSLHERTLNNPLGTITIPIKRLMTIPALGQNNILKSIQVQTGIKGGIENSTGVFVRGGGSGENLFILDDVPIYNVNHLYGFFSAFNGSTIKDIRLLKGCFPARYGGRTSSVIDIHCRDGNNKLFAGEASIGILSTGIILEGPFQKDKTTFIVSIRMSYFDFYSSSFSLKWMDEKLPKYNFYDLDARITHSISQKDKIFLSLYSGRDKIQKDNKSPNLAVDNVVMLKDYVTQTSIWGNIIGSLRWNHYFNNSLFANSTLAFTNYNYIINNGKKSILKDTSVVEMIYSDFTGTNKSGIADILLKSDFNYSISNNNKITFGAGITLHSFNPGEKNYSLNNYYENYKTDTIFLNGRVKACESYFYTENEIKTKNFLINAGLRLSGFFSTGNSSINLEPRISANYKFSEGFIIKAGYSRMVQYMHLLSTSGISLPTDIWLPASNGLKPLKSDQLSIGMVHEGKNNNLLSVELYYKWLFRTADYRYGASLFSDSSPWYEKTTQGNGRSKGIEISFEKQEGRTTGSINLTFSHSDRLYTDLNYGLTFPFQYDRLLDFNVSVNQKVFKKFDISFLWVFGTGYPVTIPVEKYMPSIGITNGPYFNLPIYFYPTINNQRLPPYHRLDIGLHFRFKNRLGENVLSFDVFNTYNRKNPINIYFWNDYTFEYLYLLPIIPSVSYTFKFN
jgi:hypothetical protein